MWRWFFSFWIVSLVGTVGVARDEDSNASKSNHAQTRNIETSYEKSSSSYRTLGRVTLSVPIQAATHVIKDFSTYGEWALRGMNGEENNPRGFIALLREMRLQARPNEFDSTSDGITQFEVLFDIDLVWPFGSRGNRIALVLDSFLEDQGQIRSFRLLLPDKNLILDQFLVQFDVDNRESGVEVTFECRTRFASWIDVFFNVHRYKQNIEWRLLRLIQNLSERTEEKMELI